MLDSASYLGPQIASIAQVGAVPESWMRKSGLNPDLHCSLSYSLSLDRHLRDWYLQIKHTFPRCPWSIWQNGVRSDFAVRPYHFVFCRVCQLTYFCIPACGVSGLWYLWQRVWNTTVEQVQREAAAVSTATLSYLESNLVSAIERDIRFGEE